MIEEKYQIILHAKQGKITIYGALNEVSFMISADEKSTVVILSKTELEKLSEVIGIAIERLELQDDAPIHIEASNDKP